MYRVIYRKLSCHVIHALLSNHTTLLAYIVCMSTDIVFSLYVLFSGENKLRNSDRNVHMACVLYVLCHCLVINDIQ